MMTEAKFKKKLVAAEAGDNEAMLVVAECYRNGDGVEQNFRRSAYWLYMAGNTEITYEFPQGLTVLEDEALWRCKGVKHVVIPEGVTTIGKMAFTACTELESVTFPSTLKELRNVLLPTARH